jgi:hypothetical protein
VRRAIKCSAYWFPSDHDRDFQRRLFLERSDRVLQLLPLRRAFGIVFLANKKSISMSSPTARLQNNKLPTFGSFWITGGLNEARVAILAS